MGHLTLIITELSSFGIAMVGDTAQTVPSITPSGTIQDRAFFGLVKVLPVHKLQAGVSYWGWAKIPPDDDNGRWMDWWLQDFIHRRWDEYNTLYDFAQLLEAELRELVPRLSSEALQEGVSDDIGGIHLAGFVNMNRTRQPCFWHIHNGQSQALPNRRIDPHVVNANYDCPSLRFRHLSRQGQGYMTRNGDIEAYVAFFEGHLTDYVRELGEHMGIIMPLPTLGHRAEFLAAQIKFISALYEVGGLIESGVIRQMTKGIGDQVTTLTITSEGIQSYFTR